MAQYCISQASCFCLKNDVQGLSLALPVERNVDIEDNLMEQTGVLAAKITLI